MLIKAGQPCDNCGSSDALAEYDNGTFCFSCCHATRTASTTNTKWLPRSQTIEVPFVSTNIKVGSRAHSFLIVRHFTDALIRAYRLSQSLDGEYLVLPGLKDEFFEIRRILPKNEPKYRTIGSKKKLFWSATEWDNNSLVICEDMLSCMRIGEFANAVALRGTRLSDETISEFCLDHKYTSYFTWFDSDKPGQEGARKFKEKLQWLGKSFCNIVTEKDPKLYTDEEIQQILTKVGYHEI